MRIPGVKTAKLLSRWAEARLFGGATLLGYHCVADGTRNDYQICVRPQHFNQQMEILRRHAHPISLLELVHHLQNGSLPERSVAVTFDDGYADNLYQAKPLLEKYEIPATVFACTGYAGNEFWWDELARLVIWTQADLRRLPLQGEPSPFRRNGSAGRREEEVTKSMPTRRQFCDALYRSLLAMGIEQRENAMDAIRNWAGPASPAPPSHRAMSHTELLQLTAGGLVDLGAHTRSHPVLPHLSPQRQTEEILSGKRELEALLGKQVKGFAYPNGRATVHAKRIVREIGFAYACTSLIGRVRSGCDTYGLTRFWQQDVDGDRFMRNLRLWGAI